MKVCKKCGHKGKTNFCPDCGNILRDTIAEQDSEVFLQAYEKDNVIAAGFHAGCGGVVDKNPTSVKNIYSYSCRKCFLRIVPKIKKDEKITEFDQSAPRA